MPSVNQYKKRKNGPSNQVKTKYSTKSLKSAAKEPVKVIENPNNDSKYGKYTGYGSKLSLNTRLEQRNKSKLDRLVSKYGHRSGSADTYNGVSIFTFYDVGL